MKGPLKILHDRLASEAHLLRLEALRINKEACDKEEEAATMRKKDTGMDKVPSRLVKK